MGIIREWLDARRQRLRREALEERHKADALERNGKHVLETGQTPWWSAVGPYGSYIQDRLWDPNFGGPLIGVGHRKYGSDYPYFQSETELALIREGSRYVCKTNPNASGILSALCSYTIGSGLDVRVNPKVGTHPAIAAKAQEEIDDFNKRNRMAMRVKEFFKRSRRDGEAGLRIFTMAGGKIEVRFFWPEQLRQPPGTNAQEWGYGVRVDPTDVEQALEYAIFPIDQEGTAVEADYVAADEVIFLKLNTDTGVRRGIPDFAWGVHDRITAHDTLVENLGFGSAAQAAIAYALQHSAQTSAESVRAFADAQAQTKTDNPITGKTTRRMTLEPGQVVHTNKNMEFVPSPYNQGAEGHLAIAQSIIRSACTRWNAPEWLGSADASNNNYSSSLVAESPFVLSILDEQQTYIDTFEPLYRLVLQSSATLPDNILDMVDLELTLPNPTVRDPLQTAQADQIAIETGWKSPQMVAAENNIDFEQVVKDFAEAKQMGLTVGPMAQPQEQPGGGGTSSPSGQQPQMESVMEGFDEAKHPRDDHGRFISGGDLEAAKSDPDKAKELRDRTTDPEQRKKLDAVIGSKSIPKEYGTDWNAEVGEDRYSRPVSEKDKIFEKVIQQKLKEVVPGDEWPFPPVNVTRGSAGPYDLTDGHHRIEVAKRLGMRIIPAVLVDQRAFGHDRPINTFVEIGEDGPPRVIQPNNETLPKIRVIVPERKAGSKRRGISKERPQPGLESVYESFDESKHPRDDHGEFVAKGELSAAKADPAKAAELRKRVTDPKQRANLNAIIGDHPQPKTSKMTDQAREIVKGKLKKTKGRAWSGEPTGGKISKQLAGAIGEEIIINHLRSLGFKDAGHLSAFVQSERNNLPVDLIHDHQVIEVKTGQASNSKEAQQWRLTIGEPSAEEKAWLAKASPEQKALRNAKKQQEIHKRKMAEIARIEKELGFKVGGKTMTVILNTETQTADIYSFDGFHDRIGWTSESAKAGYVGSVRYG